ncbi:MAG: hypothetical protein ACYTGX_06890 [Planctomycetota bacterium]|jgi:hypothetical protein
MSLKFSKIVPKLTRGEVQRKEGESAPEPEKPAAEEKPELTPEAPIEVATEFVSAPTAAAPPPESSDAPPTPDTGAFQLGGEAAQFAEDLLERAIGGQAEAAPHPDAEPAPAPAPAEEAAIPKSFGFDFDADPDAPPSELAKAVSSALTDDPPSPFPEDADGDEDQDDEAAAAADTGWLDQPAGPGVRPGGVPTHATETVDRRATPAPPPAPAPEVSPRDIANELMLAADAGDTPPGGVPAAELERLLSSALEEETAAAADASAAADGPALDPSQVAPGDFRGLAAGLIAELEASLHPAPPSTPEERS